MLVRWIGVALACAMIISLALVGLANAGEPETVYISEGGHYAAGPYYVWGDTELWVNMTVVSGGNVDVYVMNIEQYNNAYPDRDMEPLAISCKAQSLENTSEASIHKEIEGEYGEYAFEGDVYVVVDNRECGITPDDASPTGMVVVTLEVDWNTDDYFDLYPEVSPVTCLIILVVILVIVLGLIFLLYRATRGSKGGTAQYQSQYQQVTPPAQSEGDDITDPRVQNRG